MAVAWLRTRAKTGLRILLALWDASQPGIKRRMVFAGLVAVSERQCGPYANGRALRATCHRGAHWPERIEMAQWWSDHIDVLRAGATIVRLKTGKVG